MYWPTWLKSRAVTPALAAFRDWLAEQAERGRGRTLTQGLVQAWRDRGVSVRPSLRWAMISGSFRFSHAAA